MSKYLKIIKLPDSLAASYKNLSCGDFFTIVEPTECYTGVGNPTVKFSFGDLCYICRDPSKGEQKVVNLNTGECTHCFPDVRVNPVAVEATVQNRLTQ